MVHPRFRSREKVFAVQNRRRIHRTIRLCAVMAIASLSVSPWSMQPSSCTELSATINMQDIDNPAKPKITLKDIEESTSSESTPSETTPSETTPSETKPSETKPSETKPSETKPSETKPSESTTMPTDLSGLPRERKPRRDHISNYYRMFTNKEELERTIRQWNGDEKFFETYKLLFTNKPISRLINGLKEVPRRGVKERLARVVDNLEGTIAYEIEASDLDLDLRRERHENNASQGKTGIFVVFFRRFLDWILGKEYLEKKMEAARNRRRILDRLKEMGVAYETSDDELDKLQKDLASQTIPFKGEVFDPNSCTQWPNLDAQEVDVFSGIKLDQLANRKKN